MTVLLVLVAVVLILSFCIAITRRLSKLEDQVRELMSHSKVAAREAEIASFRGQLFERDVVEPAVARQPTSTSEPPPLREWTPAVAPQITPSFADRFRKAMGGSEWEALVGGSVLNKAGALVLVVGIALFLAYSFTYMSPAGRAGISSILSAAILLSGVWVERRQTYRIFSRGLIGAGWAGLYATSYAMYALPAAKVISSPFVGSLLLLVVAAGMIAHSLRYKAQAITSVAFFSAFAALTATPSTPFAIGALIPLAFALLFLAWRQQWYEMALFGLLATWGTCISRSSSDAPLYATEAIFVVYWALFEVFDWLRLRRGATNKALTFLFPLNTIAFLGLSYAAWMNHASGAIWIMSALGSAMYLAATFVRIALRTRYEPALTIAAVLAGLAIFGKSKGLWSSVGLAAEAELLYLAGVRFRLEYVRTLGTIAFPVSLASIFGPPGWSEQRPTRLGFSVQNWTAPALLHVFLFYLNRALWAPNRGFSYAASALLSLIILAETHTGFEGLALLPLAGALIEIGLRFDFADLRNQGYGAAILAAVTIISTHLPSYANHPHAADWVSHAGGTIFFWVLGARLSATALPARERSLAEATSLWLGSALCFFLLAIELPPTWVASAWAGMSLAFLVLGSRKDLDVLVLQAYAGTLAVLLRCLTVNFYDSSLSTRTARITSVSLVTAICFGADLYLRGYRGAYRKYSYFFSVAGALLLSAMLFHEVSGSVLTVAWGFEGVALLAMGVSGRVRALRLEGLTLLLTCILKLFVYDLRNLETLYRILSFIALGIILLGVSWIYTRFRDRLRQYL